MPSDGVGIKVGCERHGDILYGTSPPIDAKEAVRIWRSLDIQAEIKKLIFMTGANEYALSDLFGRVALPIGQIFTDSKHNGGKN